MIKDKLYQIIVDNGSYNNIANQELVERMRLKQRRHPSPYKMEWLTNCGAMRVSNMVTVQLSIGKYHDQVDCSVVPMQACQLLLGGPWLIMMLNCVDVPTRLFSCTKGSASLYFL
jgi:hypothetical protein